MQPAAINPISFTYSRAYVKGVAREITIKLTGPDGLYQVKQAHAQAVMTNTLEIGRRLGYLSAEKLMAAAAFHDWTKDTHRRGTNTEHLLIDDVQAHMAWFEQMGIFIDTGIEGHTTNKWIAHAPTSALKAFYEYGIADPDVLRAIAHHQTGRRFDQYGQMSMLEKVVMLADYVDEHEKLFEALAMKILLETGDIDLAMLTVLTGTVEVELFRTDKVPTPNGNLIRLRTYLYELFSGQGRLTIKDGMGEDQRMAISYINGNAEKIADLSSKYLAGNLKP